jgi:hypothetical protein
LEPPFEPDLPLVFDAPPDDDFAAARDAPPDDLPALRGPVLRLEDFAPPDEPVRLPLFALVFVEEVSESPMTLPAASFTLLMAD